MDSEGRGPRQRGMRFGEARRTGNVWQREREREEEEEEEEEVAGSYATLGLMLARLIC
jgi:hypothetical protein